MFLITRKHPLHDLFDVCVSCKKLQDTINQYQKRNVGWITPAMKKERLMPSSKFPIAQLSPASHKIRVKNICKERKSATQKIIKYESQWRQKLDNDQSSQFLSIIDQKHQDELQSVLSSDHSQLLRKEWENNKKEAKNGMSICTPDDSYGLDF